MKILNNFKIIFFFLCLSLIFTECKNEQQDFIHEVDASDTELAIIPEQQLDTETMDVLFSFLGEQKNLDELTIQDQFTMLQEFASHKGLDFDLTSAINAYEESMDRFEQPNKEDQFILDKYAEIDDLVAKHGFSPALALALEEYKIDFIASSKNLTIENASFNVVLGFVNQALYMAESPAMHDYIGKINPELLEPNAVTKGWFSCLLAQIALAGAIAGCAINPWACLGIPFAIWKVKEECGSDSVPTSPCANNPSPCCGVSCIQGYTCNSQGDCVEDPFFECDCPPYEQCLNNRCVPL